VRALTKGLLEGSRAQLRGGLGMRVAGGISALLERLTDRDTEILSELAICRYLRVDQLQRLFFPAASFDRVGQRMRHLAAGGLVRNARYGVDGVRRYSYWHLTTLGLTLAQDFLSEKAPYHTEADIRLRPHFLPHCADTAEIRVQLLLLFDAGEMVDHVYLSGPQARLEVEAPGGQIRRSTADALVAVEMPRLGISWTYWMEVDERTMTRGAVRRKAARIHRVLELHDRHPDPHRSWLQGRYLTLVLVCGRERRRWLGDAFRAAGFTGHGRPQVWTMASAADAARAIAASVRERERQGAARRPGEIPAEYPGRPSLLVPHGG
jgi:Replication-relaxation